MAAAAILGIGQPQRDPLCARCVRACAGELGRVMADEITLDIIGQQLIEMRTEITRMRDSITVLTGMSIRLEGAVHGLTLEIAGLRSMVLDHDRRLRALVDA